MKLETKWESDKEAYRTTYFLPYEGTYICSTIVHENPQIVEWQLDFLTSGAIKYWKSLV